MIEERVGALPIKFLQKYGGETRCLQRFLIARDDDPKKAEKMIHKNLAVRNQYGLDDDGGAIKEEEDKKDYELFKKLWPVKFWGFSKKGNVIVVTRLHDIKPKKFLASFQEEKAKLFYAHHVSKVISYLIVVDIF